jgi:hypothetical protein
MASTQQKKKVEKVMREHKKGSATAWSSSSSSMTYSRS